MFESLASICERKPDLKSGKRALIDCIRGAFPEYDPQVLESIDFEGLRSGFVTWLSHLVKEEPIPDHIQALWFGLFEGGFDDMQAEFLNLSGSATTPEDECDWMCITDTSYWPEGRYACIPRKTCAGGEHPRWR